MAIWQANRLAAPLVYLAASAEQLGAGQVRPQLEPSGVEEIDLVASELARSAARMAGRLAAERKFASDASHQLRPPLPASGEDTYLYLPRWQTIGYLSVYKDG